MDARDESAPGGLPGPAGTIASRFLTVDHGGAGVPPAPPFTLGHYRVLEKIGQGGMGAVFRALHLRLKKMVAIKILPPDRVGDPQAVARFAREMEAVGRLNHDHIVRATDAGEAGGVHFLVMELIEGIDVARLVRLRGPVPAAAACEIVRQAAVGLQYAHECGMVHRDVKPSNLLLSAAGQVKVLDLGLALLGRGGAASGDLTGDGHPMGTADYMAPEQWGDSHAVDIRADVYSLGCTLYTLLVGRPPFAGPKHSSLARKMAAHVGERVRRLAEERGDVPAEVEALLARMMAKEPDDRPADPAVVARALAPFCGDAGLAKLVGEALARMPAGSPLSPEQAKAASPVHVTAPAGRTLTATSGAPPRRRRDWVAGIVAAALLLGAGAAVVVTRPWTWGSGRPGPSPQGPAPSPDHAGWQNLLAKPPTKRAWPRAFGANLQHDPQREMLWVTSPRCAALTLGQTDVPNYRLQVGLRQAPWTGQVGVYLGGHEDGGPGTFRLQLIELRRTANNQNPFALVRSVGPVRDGADGDPAWFGREFANWNLPAPPDREEQLLELEVEGNVLTAVRWNGLPCSPLVSDQAGAAAGAEAECRGEFGIFCQQGTVIVSTARFLPSE